MIVSEQCGVAASKGNQIIGLIRRKITYKETFLIIPLYKVIVRPHLQYCIQTCTHSRGARLEASTEIFLHLGRL